MRYLPLLFLCAATPAFAQSDPSIAPMATPAALQLFSDDAILMHWALRNYDADGDVSLSADEALKAANGFKAIADGDRDGRVTTYEFDRGREYLIARF